jgi:hypothetical protein
VSVRRPELVLAAAVVVSLPMVPGVLNGAIGTTASLVRFLGAIVVCWVLASIVQSVIDRYSDAAARREYEVQMARVRAQQAADVAADGSGGPAGPG